MRIRLAAICLSLLMSSVASADLRIFDVDQQQQEVFVAIRNVLNRATVGDFQSNGTAEQLPNGQILVNANPEVLEQIDEVIKGIRGQPVGPAPRVTLRYWVVLGTRSPATAANALGTAPPPVLNDVLTELRRLNGDLTFRVIGTAAVASASGQRGEVEGMTLSIEQRAFVQGDALNAEIEMNVRGRRAGPAPGTPGPPAGSEFQIGTLTVRTPLQRGEFVVLGESALQSEGIDGQVFYVVHWASE
jgi:hypothetical protein